MQNKLDSVQSIPASAIRPQKQKFPPPIATVNVGVEEVSIKFLPSGGQCYVLTVYDLKDASKLPNIRIRPGQILRIALPANQPEGPFDAKK